MRFFFVVIFAKVKLVEDVRVLRFDVDGESIFVFVVILVDVMCCVVEYM